MASFGERLERYRAYLRLLARLHLDPRLRGRVGESDIVQDAFVKALASEKDFRGTTDGELCGWLRRIMANCLADRRDRELADKRDAGRDVSLDAAALHESSLKLMNFLADDALTPSQIAEKEEETYRLTLALEKLPEQLRQVIEFRFLQKLSWAEVCARLGVEHGRAVWLHDKAMKQLRDELSP